MKNASKKLFSLMLAAVLLLSVVPFQAFAAEDAGNEAAPAVENLTITFQVNVNGVTEFGPVTLEGRAPGKVSELIDEMSAYGEFVNFECSNGVNGGYAVATSCEMVNDETYILNFTKDEDNNEDNKPEEKPNENVGYKVTVYDENNRVINYGYEAVCKAGTTIDLYDVQGELYKDGKGIKAVYVNGKAASALEVTIDKDDTKIEVYTVNNETDGGNSGDNDNNNNNDNDKKDYVDMTVKVYFDNGKTQTKTFEIEKGNKVDIGDLLISEGIIDSAKEIDRIYLNGVWVNKNNNIVTVKNDGTYKVYLDGAKDFDEDDEDDETLHKGAGDAYLNIYLEQNLKTPAKRVTINSSAAKDSVVTLDECKEIVKKYFTAKDSDGIIYDGLYMKEGNWKSKWAEDEDKYSRYEKVNTMRNEGDVTFIVVIDNAKARSSSSADSSNPKTGDSIYVTFTVMTVSAIALAGAYVLNKKRMAR